MNPFRTTIITALTSAIFTISLAPDASAQSQKPQLPKSSTGMIVAGNLRAEASYRQATTEMVAAAFASDDFSILQTQYEKAISESLRSPSGLFASDIMVSKLEDAVPVPEEVYRAEPQASARLVDEHWTRLEEKVKRWGRLAPDASAPAVFLSALFVSHAYAMRHNAYASAQPSARAMFREKIEAAFQALDSRRAAGAKDPAWHAQLITIGNLQSWRPAARYDGVAANAMKSFPAYYPIYFQLALAATPIWGGSTDAVEAVAREAANRSKATEGEGLYARVYWAVTSQLEASGDQLGRADWKRMKRGFRDIIARYPDAWNKNAFARYACQARDRPALKQALGAIGNDVEYAAWPGREAFDQCVEFAK